MPLQRLKYELVLILMVTTAQAQTNDRSKLLYDLGIIIEDTTITPADTTLTPPVDSISNQFSAPADSTPRRQRTVQVLPKATQSIPPPGQSTLQGGDMDLYQLVMDYQIRVARSQLEIAKLYRAIDSLKTMIAERGASYHTDLALLEAQNKQLEARLDDIKTEFESASHPVLPENALSNQPALEDSVWEETQAVKPQAAARLKTIQNQPNRTEEQIYRDGLTKYHRESYLSALDDFKRLTGYGQDENLKASAQYYAGACYFSLALYEPAIKELIKVSEYKNSDKLDDALALRGIIYEKQGRMKETQAVFMKLVDLYPSSEYAVVATQFLQRARKLSQHE